MDVSQYKVVSIKTKWPNQECVMNYYKIEGHGVYLGKGAILTTPNLFMFNGTYMKSYTSIKVRYKDIKLEATLHSVHPYAGYCILKVESTLLD